jgi:hypothetical protein
VDYRSAQPDLGLQAVEFKQVSHSSSVLLPCRWAARGSGPGRRRCL